MEGRIFNYIKMVNSPTDYFFSLWLRTEGPEIIFRQYELTRTGGCKDQEGRKEKEGEWRTGEELARQNKK